MAGNVVFSNRAIVSLLEETKERITTETGGVFLGYYEDNQWFIIESIDPGPESIFEKAYFEYDKNYINHTINKISRVYKNQMDLIGLWHRHPGSLDEFSLTDDNTNRAFAEINEYGAISAIINIDPEFRITMYYVNPSLKYEKLDVLVGDEYIPKKFLEYHCKDNLIKQINNKSDKLNKKLL